jgi:hypothetical protein
MFFNPSKPVLVLFFLGETSCPSSLSSMDNFMIQSTHKKRLSFHKSQLQKEFQFSKMTHNYKVERWAAQNKRNRRQNRKEQKKLYALFTIHGEFVCLGHLECLSDRFLIIFYRAIIFIKVYIRKICVL